jgi:tetratricopeptide (TPR) repeat protein
MNVILLLLCIDIVSVAGQQQQGKDTNANTANVGKLRNAADTAFSNGDTAQALNLWKQVIEIEPNNDSNYYKRFRVYLRQNKLKEAKFYGLKSLTIAKELGYPEDIYSASNVLYKIYKKQDQPKEALEMHELFILMHDSINNIESKKANIKSQLKYEYEKKLLQIR